MHMRATVNGNVQKYNYEFNETTTLSPTAAVVVVVVVV